MGVCWPDIVSYDRYEIETIKIFKNGADPLLARSVNTIFITPHINL